MIQKKINDEWVDVSIDDLSNGDEYRERLNNCWQMMFFYVESKSETERAWRDSELSKTDWIVPVTDHPEHADYLNYRQELRDYPSQPDFPNGTRPTI